VEKVRGVSGVSRMHRARNTVRVLEGKGVSSGEDPSADVS